MELEVGSEVRIRVRMGMVRSRVETGIVTRITKTRLYVRSGDKDRVFVLATGRGYGGDNHCRLMRDDETE